MGQRLQTNVPWQFQALAEYIPAELFEKMISSNRPFPKEQELLLVCPVGDRTKRYVAYLRSRGYKAFNLEGGILAWRTQALDLCCAA